MNDVGEAGDVGVALLDDGQSEDREVHGDDAAADRLALALASAAGAVARVAVSEQEPDTGRVHDTLLHRETLLVVSTGDAEDVALELVADRVSGDFLSHAAVHEDAELALVFDLDQLLCAIVGVGDVELHLDGGSRTAMCCNVSIELVREICAVLNFIFQFTQCLVISEPIGCGQGRGGSNSLASASPGEHHSSLCARNASSALKWMINIHFG